MAQGQRSNTLVVPQARQAMDQLKFETAAEIGIPNYQGYLGDVPSRLNGAVGGNMVRKMIQAYQSSAAGTQQSPGGGSR
ncbi:MAG: small, acid-soluble spore protein, alpha/beta type [Bacillota bacterium]